MTDSTPTQPQLNRAIGRWSLVALTINSLLGSAIFGLPSVLAMTLGNWSPWAVFLAGLATAIVVGCYAEVASQFTQTGGTYLYLRYVFGRFVGLQVAWVNLLARITALAAAMNLFVSYLGEFWPGATQPLPRFLIIVGFFGTLAAINYRGVSGGTRVSNISGVAKLLPLILLCGLGVLALKGHRLSWGGTIPDIDSWLTAFLLMFFAYGGYEAALYPMGEASDPRRDAPFALFVALLTVIVLYTLLQLTVITVLRDPTASTRPLAEAARALAGQTGAAVVSIGAMVSVYGFVSANMLTGPRLAFALAQMADFPAAFGAVHPRYRTPYWSIIGFGLLAAAFAIAGSFAWNVTLSAVARLLYYAAICLAVPILRRRQPEAASFRLPGGTVLPVFGILICVAMLSRVDFSRAFILIATIAGAALNWLLVRNRHAIQSGPAAAAER